MEREKTLRQRLVVLLLLAGVVVVDQAAKWWAWRNVPGVQINPGGDFLTGATIGHLYDDPATGAMLDLADFGLLSIAVTLLARRPRGLALTVSGSVMVGGWASNLLDRLGMHYWTAPGSVRGAVDFIIIGNHCCNLADFFIVGATPAFLLAVFMARRAPRRADVSVPAAAARIFPRVRAAFASLAFPRARASIVAIAGTGLIVTVALGAANQGTLIKPVRASAACCHMLKGGLRSVLDPR